MSSTSTVARSLTLPEAPPRAVSEGGDIELSGIVLDRTITRFGKDFFFYYTGYWRDVPDTEGLTVVIHEQVYPQAGTRLWVEMEQETIFQTYFGRRHTDVKKVAEQAVLISLDKVVEIKARAAADSILEKLQ
ncbi:MAG: curli production assembly/transport protein CsgE [Idiomarina sp.]|nr:curli production assembly/transport protein CsgE [Idiomarina sp.]